jgi:hypothetical protein
MTKYRLKQINADCYVIEKEFIDSDGRAYWQECNDRGYHVTGATLQETNDEVVLYWGDEGREDAIAMIEFWLKYPDGFVVYEAGV